MVVNQCWFLFGRYKQTILSSKQGEILHVPVERRHDGEKREGEERDMGSADCTLLE